MMAAFADSGFYIAVILTRDAKHVEAISVAQSWTGAVITTREVLTEVGNYLSRGREHRQRFAELLVDIEGDPRTEVVEVSHDLWQQGVELYSQRPDKQWSLTDCISFVVMQDRGIAEALTADHHFEQAGFKMLLGR